MVSVKRTAYPSLKKQLSEEELTALYSLSQKEMSLIYQNANGSSQRLTFAVLLKTYQGLHYFPNLQSVPHQVKEFLAKQLGLANETPLLAEANQKKTRSRYRKTIRKYLKRKLYKEEGIELLKAVITKTAYTMSDPADLINVAIEELVKEHTELPAFSTLDRLTSHLRTQVHEKIYQTFTKKLTTGQKSTLEKLLNVSPNEFISDFIRLKQTPNTPTLGHIRMWTERLEWIKKILDPNPFLQEIPFTKIRQFASEAHAYSIADMRGIANKGKKFTLLLCLLHRSQMETVDALVDMFLRRMRRTENAAREELRLIQDKHRDWEESLISVLGEVLDHTTEEEDATFGKQVRKILNNKGGVDTLKGIYEKVSAYHHNNYLSLLWPIHSKYRAVLFQLFDLIEIVSATQDQYLIQAFEFVKKYRHTHRRKLGTRSRKNKLYLAFREVGRVERTLFLMQYISDPKFRREIQSETTKIESFNSFLDWISFGGPIVKDGDPEEQEKQLKYMNLVANAIMLSNIVDLTNVINQMIQEKKVVTPKLISKLSPYMRQHIRRFGQYTLDMDEKPEILKPTSIKFLGENLK